LCGIYCEPEKAQASHKQGYHRKNAEEIVASVFDVIIPVEILVLKHITEQMIWSDFIELLPQKFQGFSKPAALDPDKQITCPGRAELQDKGFYMVMEGGKMKIFDHAYDRRSSAVYIRPTFHSERFFQVKDLRDRFGYDVGSLLVGCSVKVSSFENIQSSRFNKILVNAHEPEHREGIFVSHIDRGQTFVAERTAEEIGG
jgi:hypothetical protein